MQNEISLLEVTELLGEAKTRLKAMLLVYERQGMETKSLEELIKRIEQVVK